MVERFSLEQIQMVPYSDEVHKYIQESAKVDGQEN